VPASELRERVRDGLSDSLRAHLLADVEVGIFLSAGVDSGSLLGLALDTVVAVRSKLCQRRLQWQS
jgi:asparagine synthase (glutamine-hydrolysing)